MRFTRILNSERTERATYLQVAPYTNIIAAVFIMAALWNPKAMGVPNRLFLAPSMAAVLISGAYFVLLKLKGAPRWFEVIRGMALMGAITTLFTGVDPVRSSLWVMLILPFVGIVPHSTNRKGTAKKLFWVFSLITVYAFAIHAPVSEPQEAFLGWLAVGLIKLVAIFGISACSWVARKNDRQQRRALFAAYAKLAQKQKHIVQTERFAALGELSSGVAHEINNSLIVLMGGLDAVKDCSESGRVDWADLEKHIERMERATTRIHRVVSQMRSLSRDGRKDPPALFDLRNALSDSIFLVREQLSTRNIAFDTEVPSEPVYVMGHMVELSQVIINLINNARDALEKAETKQLKIVIRKHGTRVHVEVIDSGPGMPPEVQNRAFIPFVTTKSVGKGTGLGLSISYGIIRRHNGHLSFRTSPKGTVFKIDLPIAQTLATQGEAA